MSFNRNIAFKLFSVAHNAGKTAHLTVQFPRHTKTQVIVEVSLVKLIFLMRFLLLNLAILKFFFPYDTNTRA